MYRSIASFLVCINIFVHSVLVTRKAHGLLWLLIKRCSLCPAELGSMFRIEVGSCAVLEASVSAAPPEVSSAAHTGWIPVICWCPSQQEARQPCPLPAVQALTLLHTVHLRAHFSAQCYLRYNELGAH